MKRPTQNWVGLGGIRNDRDRNDRDQFVLATGNRLGTFGTHSSGNGPVAGQVEVELVTL